MTAPPTLPGWILLASMVPDTIVVPDSLGITSLEFARVTSSLAATANPVATSTGNPRNKFGRSTTRIGKASPSAFWGIATSKLNNCPS